MLGSGREESKARTRVNATPAAPLRIGTLRRTPCSAHSPRHCQAFLATLGCIFDTALIGAYLALRLFITVLVFFGVPVASNQHRHGSRRVLLWWPDCTSACSTCLIALNLHDTQLSNWKDSTELSRAHCFQHRDSFS
jgi:hypothetical protein